MSSTEEDGVYLPKPILYGHMVLVSILVLSNNFFKIVCFEMSLIFFFINWKKIYHLVLKILTTCKSALVPFLDMENSFPNTVLFCLEDFYLALDQWQ